MSISLKQGIRVIRVENNSAYELFTCLTMCCQATPPFERTLSASSRNHSLLWPARAHTHTHTHTLTHTHTHTPCPHCLTMEAACMSESKMWETEPCISMIPLCA